MSNPTGTPILYSALARTEGYEPGAHIYEWSFSDGATATGASTNKTWAAPGLCTATVKATNVHTGGAATASMGLDVIDPTVFEWHDTGSNMGIFTTSGWGLWQTRDNLFGDKIIIFGSYNYPRDVVVYDTVSNTVVRHTNALPAEGAGGARLLTDGPLAGKVLLFGMVGGAYGYWDLAASAYTQIASSGGPRRGATHHSVPSAWSGSTLLCATALSDYSTQASGFCRFDQGSLAFGVAFSTSTYVSAMVPLPSGSVMVFKDNTTACYIVSTGDNVTSGPTANAKYPYPTDTMGFLLRDGRVAQISKNALLAYDESTGTWGSIASYPYALIKPSSTGNDYSMPSVAPDGCVFDVGGRLSGGETTKGKNCCCFPAAGVFKVWGVLPYGAASNDALCVWRGNVPWLITSNGKIYYGDAYGR